MKMICNWEHPLLEETRGDWKDASGTLRERGYTGKTHLRGFKESALSSRKGVSLRGRQAS
jgi:hypothetical protein